ncbi:MAG: hypothetical protein JWM58_2490 [Rhizobium sp.]|nr:hypothetical protein [Rhizobium sp.]
MNILRIAVAELIGMFIDDGNLAAFSLLLIIAVAGAVKFLALPPLLGGILVLAGCLVILAHSVYRAARR